MGTLPPLLTVRIDGIDRNFLFGNVRLPLFVRGCRYFPSCFGVIQVSEGLALIITNYSDISRVFDLFSVTRHSTGYPRLPGGLGWGTNVVVRPTTGKRRFRYIVGLF